MFQRKINCFSTFQRFFTIPLLLLAGCNAISAAPIPRLPWRTLWQFDGAAFDDPPALWTNETQTLLAWPGEPGSPGIRWVGMSSPRQGSVPAEPIAPSVLPLGKTPRALAMVPAHEGWMHLLWLDESLPGEVRVWTTVVSADGHVDHAPISVNNKVTSTYFVLALANGSALTLWTDASRRSSLYAQVLDDVGRPFGAVYLSDNVNFPSAALDLAGRLHLAWLEAQSPSLWIIHYLLLSDPRSLDFQASLEPPQNAPIGLIHLTAGQTIGSFAIAADASRVYMLWTALDASKAASSAGVIGSAHGLAFPLDNDNALSTLSFAASGLDSAGSAAQSNVRSLYIQKVAEKTLAVGALVGNWDEKTSTWLDSPAALPITPSGVGALQPVFEGTPGDTLGDVALASDPGGGLVMAWTTLHANGKSTITLASTR